MAGSVDARGLVLRKRISYRNSFQYTLTASLADEAGGTRIRGRFAMHPVVVVFAAAWLVVVGFAAAAFLTEAAGPLLRGAAPEDGWIVMTPVWMLLGMAAMLGIGRWLGEGESRFLAGFVCETVDAPGPSAAG